ncbi:39S ribosomal protein L49, mitochondrial [Hemicordylus capensis]|uniref:39S ribosomal protein L49, mitochondrial n=1 Tax=Hemicordylus capensis TaxID=884348 RepID=UPI002302278B|nr:39S ribosomal protein L49, mitochondrial [Hemicordylus capensis]
MQEKLGKTPLCTIPWGAAAASPGQSGQGPDSAQGGVLEWFPPLRREEPRSPGSRPPQGGTQESEHRPPQGRGPAALTRHALSQDGAGAKVRRQRTPERKGRRAGLLGRRRTEAALTASLSSCPCAPCLVTSFPETVGSRAVRGVISRRRGGRFPSGSWVTAPTSLSVSRWTLYSCCTSKARRVKASSFSFTQDNRNSHFFLAPYTLDWSSAGSRLFPLLSSLDRWGRLQGLCCGMEDLPGPQGPGDIQDRFTKFREQLVPIPIVKRHGLQLPVLEVLSAGAVAPVARHRAEAEVASRAGVRGPLGQAEPAARVEAGTRTRGGLHGCKSGRRPSRAFEIFRHLSGSTVMIAALLVALAQAQNTKAALIASLPGSEPHPAARPVGDVIRGDGGKSGYCACVITRRRCRFPCSKMAAFALAKLARGGFRKEPLSPWLGGRRWWLPPLGVSRLSHAAAEANSADSKYPGIIESTEEYKFVERLLPPTRIPVPPKQESYPTPSGWRPPQDPPPALPYFVRRSRMHNIPVYTDITHGCRKMTVIRKIEGDIWALEKEVKEFLTPLLGRTPATQVHEVACSIRIKGYFDQELKTWLMDKGF